MFVPNSTCVQLQCSNTEATASVCKVVAPGAQVKRSWEQAVADDDLLSTDTGGSVGSASGSGPPAAAPATPAAKRKRISKAKQPLVHCLKCKQSSEDTECLKIRVQL